MVRVDGNGFEFRFQPVDTTTDGVPDDNLSIILGGGVTMGYHFTPKIEGYGSYDRILAKKGDAREWLVRYQLRGTF